MKTQITSEMNDKPKLRSELALNAFIRAVKKVHAEDARIAAEEMARTQEVHEQEKSDESKT